MPDRTASGPMSKCPVCGRTGLVGKEHEIVGRRAVTVYKCHGCDNSWRVRDDDEAPIQPVPRAPRTPPRLPADEPVRSSRRQASAEPRIVILSIGRAEQYQPQHDEICVSITDPRAPAARLSPGFKAVLRLGFSDIASPSPFAWHVLFTPAHAQEILDFIDRWPDVERIVIHCVGGQSRSPAVGIAVCELKGWPLGQMEAEHPLWNTWVRSELLRIGRAQRTSKSLPETPAAPRSSRRPAAPRKRSRLHR